MEKKVLMIIAPGTFIDEELREPKAILEREGFEVVIVSTVSGTAKGMFGMQVNPDTTVDDVIPEDFDAVVVVDGEIITGEGSEAARESGQKIAENLLRQS